MVSNEVIVFDNVLGRIHLITHGDPAVDGSFERAQERLQQMTQDLHADVPKNLHDPVRGPRLHEADFVSSYGEEAYKADVEKIKDYIVEGDVMQVVLAQRMSVAFESDPLNLYRALRSLNPSPYMYFIDLGETQIVGSSPEVLVRVQNRRVTLRPIAGTRHRGSTPAEDQALAAELLSDPKECAEHLMLIDLIGHEVSGKDAEAALGLAHITTNKNSVPCEKDTKKTLIRVSWLVLSLC